MRKSEIYKKLEELYKKIDIESKNYLGYPNNLKLDNKKLSVFLDYPINNIGDPFTDNNCINTFDFEREVLDYYRSLLSIDKDEYWGYVTTGGTEGNLFGLLSGRSRYPKGTVYYSGDSHYSIRKSVYLLNISSCRIRTDERGEMDYDHLNYEISRNKKSPPIIVANIGSTMKGAVDNIEIIEKILRDLNIEHFYIHCDAALMGGIIPYITDKHVVDFTLPIDSVSISGHKFLGSPIPCGVVITRKKTIKELNNRIEYIASEDGTITGSRNGISALILWKTIQQKGYLGLLAWAKSCIEKRDYVMIKLKEIEWPAWHHDLSNTVVIKKPSTEITKKWHLATQNNIAHIITMPSTEKEHIDKFITDLRDVSYGK